MLPDMPSQSALERAEQWRREFAGTTVESNGASIRATLSIGVAMCPTNGSSMDELVRAADLALYDAKDQGRDRVVLGHPAEMASALRSGPPGQPRAGNLGASTPEPGGTGSLPVPMSVTSTSDQLAGSS